MEVSIKGIGIGGVHPPRLMGVLNISPESFFSDSFTPREQVATRIEEMLREGADIIDIGARSTALIAPPISVAEEKDRIVRALRTLDLSGAVFSLDTMYPEVLEAALRYEIAAINDISGLSNERYAKIAADSGLPVIAMTTRKRPGDPTDITSTHMALKEIINRAERYNIDQLILDPGIGKWVAERSSEADWELCRRFSELKVYGFPLLAAASRKTFIGDCLNKPPHERLYGSLGVLYALLEGGADILRVHDVAPSKDIVKVFQMIHR
ncbi:MAG TPA: dihydropteroate synthase [Methanocorpusculum sp.]|nr:dihydropteroate synthase [Methanocorpusculum sp.]HJJ50359.1 dihydropteroate synthase [Methanocorpusculum sp.]HKL98266.1 dihydropteroate synthase [Methanocorpusculum sp.]